MTTETCVHWWLLEDGNEARGLCKFCGAERVHTGGLPPIDQWPAVMSRTAKPRNRGLDYRATEVTTHGSGGYRKGCRCADCRAAHAEVQRRYETEKRGKAVA